MDIASVTKACFRYRMTCLSVIGQLGWLSRDFAAVSRSSIALKWSDKRFIWTERDVLYKKTN